MEGEHTICFILDNLSEGILRCHKELIEIAEELDGKHEDEVKSVCGEIVNQLEKIKPLDY